MPWIKMDSFQKVAAVQVKAKLAEMHKACAQAESICFWLLSPGALRMEMNSDINGDLAIQFRVADA